MLKVMRRTRWTLPPGLATSCADQRGGFSTAHARAAHLNLPRLTVDLLGSSCPRQAGQGIVFPYLGLNGGKSGTAEAKPRVLMYALKV